MYLRQVGVVSVFAGGFNVLATGGGCTDLIVHGKVLSGGVLGLLEVSVSAILCHGLLYIFTAIFPLRYPGADVTFR